LREGHWIISLVMMKEHAPSTLRNRDPILDVLKRVLPSEGLVLEVASGSGEHASYFAQHLTGLTWQPSAKDADSRASIRAWAADTGSENLLDPVDLDVLNQPWPVEQAAAIVCTNMVHISPWQVSVALIAGAGRVLRAGGVLYLYGPYKINGAHTAPSNQAFDENLRYRDPKWGIRDLDDVITEAAAHGLTHAETVAMPANNQSVIFKRT
jgi:SAM-dependent methyltransferase